MKEKDRDWDREMAEVDKLLAKLPESDPLPGHSGEKTVPLPKGGVFRTALTPGPRGERVATWLRVGLALLLGVGVVAWPYSHVCGAKLLFYTLGVVTLIVAGGWAALSSWKRRLGLAHVLSLGLVLVGLVLAAGVLLPRVGYAGQEALWFCPEPTTPLTR